MKAHNYQTITVNYQANTAIITLSRPEKKNAMSFHMMRELIDIAKELKQNSKIRAVIITGSGDDFCSGIDLSDLNQPKAQGFALWELIKPTQSLFQKACLIWQSLPIPVIAVINGNCLGAGLQLIMSCDIRIASASSRFAIMEAKWGLVADMGITKSALGIMNIDTLKELAMTARIIDGTEAKNLSLITHLVDDTEAKANSLIEEIVNRSPDSVLASKRLINRMYQQSRYTLYQEKIWQTKLILGKNRKIAFKKAKDSTVKFIKRQFD